MIKKKISKEDKARIDVMTYEEKLWYYHTYPTDQLLEEASGEYFWKQMTSQRPYLAPAIVQYV